MRVMLSCLAAALLACQPLPLAAQSPAVGQLLVSTGELVDPNFAESVVLLLQYDENGAAGVLVNRPTWVTPDQAFPELDFLSAYRGRVFLGGPVASATLSALVRVSRPATSGLERLADEIYVGTSAESLSEILATGPDELRLRLYAGIASWGPGQLDREVRSGHWRVVPAHADLVFSPEPERLWRKVSETAAELLVAVPAGRAHDAPRIIVGARIP